MRPSNRQHAVGVVVRVLLELFPGAEVTADDDVEGELAALAFSVKKIDIPFRVRHALGPTGVFALLVKEALLEEDFDEAGLKARLKSSDLQDLVRQFPHGTFELRPEGMKILSEEGLP